MKTLVLGANGHIGCHIVRKLVTDGREVRALVRPNSNLRSLHGLDVEIAIGNVLDRDSVSRALKGVDRVYHLATPTIDTPGVSAIAVEGTDNVLECARATGSVSRLIYTSSIVTLGYAEDIRRPLTEARFHRSEATPYHAAKFDAERLLLDKLQEPGIPPTVIVKPATTIGPLDFRPTPANRLVLEYMRRPSPFYFDAGLTIADVEDVAQGHILAEKFGTPGRAYIIGGELLQLRELFWKLADFIGAPRPRLRAGRTATILAAAALQFASLFTRRPPLMTIRQAKEFAGRYGAYSSARAEKELGYTWRPADDAILRCLRWFSSSPLLPEPQRSRIAARLK